MRSRPAWFMARTVDALRLMRRAIASISMAAGTARRDTVHHPHDQRPSGEVARRPDDRRFHVADLDRCRRYAHPVEGLGAQLLVVLRRLFLRQEVFPLMPVARPRTSRLLRPERHRHLRQRLEGLDQPQPDMAADPERRHVLGCWDSI